MTLNYSPPEQTSVEVPKERPLPNNNNSLALDYSPPTDKERWNIKMGDKRYYMYDGDTIIDQRTGKRIRIAGYDAGELSRIGEFGEYHAGSFAGQAEKEAINNIIREEGFDRLEDAAGDQYKTKDGEKVDKYDRPIKDLFNKRGESLSDYLHRERVVDRNAYTTQRQELLRRLGDYADWVNEREGEVILSSGDKARELVESAILPINPRRVEVEGTFEEVFRGSAEEEDWLQASLNELNAELLITEDPARRAELMEEISAAKEQLMHSINTNPLALTMSAFPRTMNYTGSPGFWGEQVNAAEKSYHMLSNTMGGFSAWLGDALNIETLEDWGNDWALETTEDLMEAGYTTDFWSVRNPYDALRFTTTSIVQYAPQMGAIWAASAAGGAIGSAVPIVGTGAGMIIGGVGAGFVLAVSSVYQGQPEGEKDPMMAGIISLPIAVADKLGLGKLASGRFLSEEVNFLTKEGKEKWINWAVDQTRRNKGKFAKKWTREQAEEYLKRGIKDVLAESAEFLQDSANAQLLARKTFKDIALQAGKGGAVEMFTEGLQQVIEEGGLAATTSINFDMEQTLYNTIEASAVGGVLGASFNLPFSIKEQEKYNEIIWSALPEDQAKRSDLSKWEEDQKKFGNGKKLTKMGVVKRSLERIQDKGEPNKLENLAANADNANGIISDFISALGNPKRFVQGFRGFLSDFYKKGNGQSNIILQQIGDLMGHINILGGNTVTAETRALDSNWNRRIPSRARMSKDLGIKEQDLYRYLPMDEKTLREQGLSENTVQGIISIQEDFKALGNDIIKEVEDRENRLGPLASKFFNLSYKNEDNKTWLQKFRDGRIFLSPFGIDYKKVDKNFEQLIAAEEDKDGVSLPPEEIETIMGEIRGNNLSMKSRERLEELGIFDDDKYYEYLSKRPYEDISSYIRGLSKDIVFQSRFGKNGEILADLLEVAQNRGEISEQQKYNFAAQISDYLKMNKGTYKPIKNKFIKRMQDHLLFFSTITYMDSNFFANMAEMTNGLIGLSPRQMFKYIRTTGVTFSKQVAVDLQRGAALTGAVRDKTKRELAETDDDFERGVLAGTIPPKGTISYIESHDSTNPGYQTFLNWFWTWNQVESQTNAGRAARGSMAWENISKAIAAVADEKNGVVTGKSRAARNDLLYWGLDADRLVKLYKKANNNIPESALLRGNLEVVEDWDLRGLTLQEQKELKEAYRVGLINFTDEFVVRPEPGSTPKWIEDPRFALFTQFKRFISHFFANVVPRAWRGYIASGKPAMPRQVFTIILSSYAMAFLSQMIKDVIVYGGTPPWMEDDEEDPDWFKTTYSRAASYTGWGGTPYMALEAISEYNRAAAKKGPIENILDSIAGESPVLNTLNTDFRTSYKTPGEKIAKRIPFLGDVKQSRESIAELLNSIGD